jgi:hypothetical protein
LIGRRLGDGEDGEKGISSIIISSLGDWLHTCAPRAAGDANVRDVTEICAMQVKLLCASTSNALTTVDLVNFIVNFSIVSCSLY